MNITITAVPSRNKEKIWYTFEWGKGPGQRKAVKVFSYVKPKNQVEKNHNKQAQLLLATKKSQLILESQATGLDLYLLIDTSITSWITMATTLETIDAEEIVTWREV